MITSIILVGIGGGAGALLRALLSDIISNIWHKDYPLATFLINITGSFALGMLLHYHMENYWMLLLGTGFMGGYTTFSTFNYQLVFFMKSDRKLTFALYYSLSVICGLAAAALGFII